MKASWSPVRQFASLAPLVGVASTIVMACGTVHPTAQAIPTNDAGPTVEPDAETDANDAALPRPYPPGPYGGAIGDRMADFVVQGYPLSRAQRHSTSLPFRDVSLNEARTDECTCMVVIWDAVGNCAPSINEYEVLSAQIATDPTLCALEIAGFNFDAQAAAKDGVTVPATRADLDAWVSDAEQPYPVGLVTSSASSALSSSQILSIPQNIIVRPNDMTIVGYVDGMTDDFIASVKSLCASPHPATADVATGLSPTLLMVDDENAYVTDTAGLVRLGIAAGNNGQRSVLVSAADPNVLTMDTANVYVSARGGDAGNMFSLMQVDKATGAGKALLSLASRIVAISSDSSDVYVAREDGVIGSVPVAGGPFTQLSSGEAAPAAIAVDATNVYFIAAGEVASIPKLGGARTSLAAAGSLAGPDHHPITPALLAVRDAGVFVAGSGTAPLDGSMFLLTPQKAPQVVVSNATAPTSLAISADRGRTLLTMTSNDGAQGSVSGFGSPKNIFDLATIARGQGRANAVAQNKTHVYWTVAESGPGAHDGVLRRVTP